MKFNVDSQLDYEHHAVHKHTSSSTHENYMSARIFPLTSSFSLISAVLAMTASKRGWSCRMAVAGNPKTKSYSRHHPPHHHQPHTKLITLNQRFNSMNFYPDITPGGILTNLLLVYFLFSSYKSHNLPVEIYEESVVEEKLKGRGSRMQITRKK